RNGTGPVGLQDRIIGDILVPLARHRGVARHAELDDEIRHDAEKAVAIKVTGVDEFVKSLHALGRPILMHLHNKGTFAGCESDTETGRRFGGSWLLCLARGFLRRFRGGFRRSGGSRCGSGRYGSCLGRGRGFSLLRCFFGWLTRAAEKDERGADSRDRVCSYFYNHASLSF